MDFLQEDQVEWDPVGYVLENSGDYLRKYKDSIQTRIYYTVKIYTIKTGGVSHKQLSHVIGIDRKNLRKHVKELIKKGLIIKEVGLQGKYLAKYESYDDPLLLSSIFGEYFRDNILSNHGNIILNSRKLTQVDENWNMHKYDFTSYTSFYEPKFRNNETMERMLFEFSNRIGAFIIYTLIQSMNPEIYKMKSQPKSGLAQTWFENSISQLTPFICARFKHMVNMASGNYPLNPYAFLEYLKKSVLPFEKDLFLKLISAFTNLYPLLSYEFEKVMPYRYQYEEILRNEAPSVESFVEGKVLLNKLLRNQENCKHKYGELFTSVLGFKVRECSKCHHMERPEFGKKSRKVKRIRTY